MRAASRSAPSPSQTTASASTAASVSAPTPSTRRCARSRSAPSCSATCSRSRSICSVFTWLPNWSADARPARTPSASSIAGALAWARTSSRASVNASSASRSSTNWKCGEISASSGNRRSSDWLKAWMVPIRMPPGRSSTVANSARAAWQASTVGSTCRSRNAFASAAGVIVTQRPSVFCSRSDISAAAALVKVRHWMRSGRAPASIRRSSRSVSSLVLPDPAEAATNADTAGSEALSCSRLARSRAGSRIIRHPSPVITVTRHHRHPSPTTRRPAPAVHSRRIAVPG